MGKPKPHPSPFERFEKFTKSLLAVPRAEVQKKLNKYNRKKSKKRS